MTTKEKEDKVMEFFGKNDELDLIAWKFLVIAHPHWSRNINEIDRLMSKVKKDDTPAIC